ncbi:MAG TPA: rod shape-determining protein RodA [Lachnospiraceae bacterium]|nr:rod shape-determining protein RodA [Lachnospiraceae bacterium]
MNNKVAGGLIHNLRKLGKMDAVLLSTVVLLNLMGLVSINSISEIVGIDGILIKQTAGSLIGIVIMLVLSVVDYRPLAKYYIVLYGIIIAALAAVLVFGTSAGGAKRWIGVAGITFQPSELAKILLILFYSEFIINHIGAISRWKVFAVSTLLILPPVLMILKEPDLSTAVMVLLIFCVILFVAGISGKVIAGFFAAAVPAFLILLFLVLSGGSTFLGGYQTQRILAWIHPEDYASSTAYQTMNSMTAIGSGRLIGKGLSTGTSGTLLGTGFISESQTDFIFAVIGEQFGFLGCTIMIILITVVAIRCCLIAAGSSRLSDKIIASGMAAWIGLQSYLNIGVATGLLPNTGIPLPFVSYGLTSLICLYGGLGFVQNICIRNRTASQISRKPT